MGGCDAPVLYFAEFYAGFKFCGEVVYKGINAVTELYYIFKFGVYYAFFELFEFFFVACLNGFKAEVFGTLARRFFKHGTEVPFALDLMRQKLFGFYKLVIGVKVQKVFDLPLVLVGGKSAS